MMARGSGSATSGFHRAVFPGGPRPVPIASRPASGRPPTGGVAVGGQPGSDGGCPGLASDRPAELTCLHVLLPEDARLTSLTSMTGRCQPGPTPVADARTLCAGCRRMPAAPEIIEVAPTQLEDVLHRVEVAARRGGRHADSPGVRVVRLRDRTGGRQEHLDSPVTGTALRQAHGEDRRGAGATSRQARADACRWRCGSNGLAQRRSDER